MLGDGDAGKWRFCPSVSGACFRAVKKVHPNPEVVAPAAAAPAAAPAHASSLTEAKDMLEAVSRLAASATKSVQATNKKETAAAAVLHPLLVGLNEMADTLLHELTVLRENFGIPERSSGIPPRRGGSPPISPYLRTAQPMLRAHSEAFTYRCAHGGPPDTPRNQPRPCP